MPEPLTQQSAPRKGVTILLPITILSLAIAISWFLFLHPPKEKKGRAPKRPILNVQTITTAPQEYQVNVHGFGTVQPESEGSVVSQIQGLITKIGDNVQAGSFFQKGELLFQIDDRDYLAALNITEAALSEAKAKLVEEEARSNQALLNWQRLGNGEEASALVLRKPYLETAKAVVRSAEAKREQALLALERTRITAPYTGRILAKHVAIGQYVGVGKTLATIYPTQTFEVRVPLNYRQQNLLTIPQQGDLSISTVEIRGGHGRDEERWLGHIARTEAILDTKNQQLTVVIRINASDNIQEGHPALPKIGQFVRVSIPGKIFKEVFLIPSHALYTNDEVIILHDGRLMRRQVSVINRSEKHAIIDSGLQSGEHLVITPLGAISSGTEAVEKKRRPAKVRGND